MFAYRRVKIDEKDAAGLADLQCGSGAADGNGDGDTGDVTEADGAADGRGQSLEVGDLGRVALTARALPCAVHQ